MLTTLKKSTLSTTLSDLSHQSDEVDFAASATKFAYSLGFEWVTYCSTETPIQMFSTYPKSWRERYKSLEYYKVDPVCRLVYVKGKIVSWNLQLSEPLLSSQKEIEFLGDAYKFGICSGISLKIGGTPQKNSVITLSSRNVIFEETLRTEAIERQLFQWGCEFEDHLNAKLLQSSKRKNLTKRQRECLSLAAQGLSAKMIAARSGLSPRTIEFHLEEAKKRLRVSTIAQAVSVATREELGI